MPVSVAATAASRSRAVGVGMEAAAEEEEEAAAFSPAGDDNNDIIIMHAQAQLERNGTSSPPPSPTPAPPGTSSPPPPSSSQSTTPKAAAHHIHLDAANGSPVIHPKLPTAERNAASAVQYNSALEPAASATMSSVLSSSEAQASPAALALDPISRQILERTQSHHRPQQISQSGASLKAPHAEAGPPEDQHSAKIGSDPTALRRVDSAASSKVGKDKKKGVSFLSRIMGTKKRDSFDIRDDDVSEISDNRSAGVEAEVFSQPVGFIPKFPAPPRYIKVKAQYRKRKDFDRLFLAQVLLDTPKSKSRKLSIDSKIHSIKDAPGSNLPHSSNPASNAIWAMEFSKDGRYLAAAGQDRKLRVWEVISTAEEREMDEKLAETNTEGERVRLNAPVFKSKLLHEYEGHTSSILDLSWSKNNFLLSSSMDKTVRLYHVSRDECLCAFRHNDFVTSIQFHPRDDRFFLAGSLDSKLRLWSIPDKTVAYWVQVPDMVTAVAFTPDGKTAIAGCLNGLCILYDTEGLKAHSQIHVRSARGKNAKGSKITGIDTIALPRDNGQPDVKLLITSNDSRVRMYNLKDRTLEVKFRGNENTCSQIHATFSDDGKYVICGSEDRKVYIWPTSINERPDNDKRPMEVFEAHSAIVTTALLAPEKTRRLLAQSGDPLYDLCNPPPVTLVSRADSVISSRAPTSINSEDKHHKQEKRNSESPKRAPETPAYLARHSHPGGQIIVTADYTGQIKVFRQDCAYQKRRHESWDTSSTFSKKVLGRSGSVATRTSGSTSLHRNSFALSSKNHSTDRILNWRNTVSANHAAANASTGALEARGSLGNGDRSRSASPRKLLSPRLPTRKTSPPTKEASTSPTVNGSHSPSIQAQRMPSISVHSPLAESPASFHSAPQATSPERRNSEMTTGLTPVPSNPTLADLPRNANDPLFLMDQQSYLAWDVKNTLMPMAAHTPRSPGLLNAEGNPLSREGSYVSQLSSDLTGSEHEGNSTRSTSAKGQGRAGGDVDDVKTESQVRRSRGRRRQSADSENDLRCRECGSKTFKATMTDTGQSFRCKKCGTVV
ncbi:putative WD repeat-containing protein C3H5.08c [Exophiala dermatitidis]